MSALRFGAGIGAGVALAALVVGAATNGAPTAAEPDAASVSVPARAEPKPGAASAPARADPAAAKKPAVERGVLARAAASRRPKAPEGAPPATPAGEAAPDGRSSSAKEPVIQSVEVDWGAPQPRP